MAGFDSERKRLIESGTDLQKDTAAVKRLDDLHQAYKAVADEAGDCRSGCCARSTARLVGGPSREDKGIPGFGVGVPAPPRGRARRAEGARRHRRGDARPGVLRPAHP